MTTSLSIVVLVLVAFGSCTAGNKHFSHLGSLKLQSKGVGILSGFDEFNYYVSISAADWVTARADCRAQLGGDLLSFDTREEAAWIANQLDQYGSAVNYWTAGQVMDKDFIFWATSGNLLPIWLNWSAGHPPANSSPVLRVKIRHINHIYSFYEVDTGSKALRYICKV